MTDSLAKTEIVLVGHTQAELRGTKLPSNREVLQCMFYYIRNRKQTHRQAAATTIRKVVLFWNSAGIPTIAEIHSVPKLDRLYLEHRSVMRNIRCEGSIGQTVRQSDFVCKLDNIFDITHLTAFSKLTDKEAIEFLNAQRVNRSGNLKIVVNTAS